jgi:predicted PurR-regulated permease PerM
VLVALSINPMTALWVALCYLVMNEATGNLVAPVVRGSAMEIHPVVILFYTIAMASAFGLVGALIATPLAAFVKAYYDEFYLAARSAPSHMEASVEMMLERAPRRH